MKKFKNHEKIIILLMFFCLNVSGQHTFTYTEIKNSINNVDEFIEKLVVDKDFSVVEKYKSDNIDFTKFVKNKNTIKISVRIAIPIQEVKENAMVMIEMHFYDDPNFKYLIDSIRLDCTRFSLVFNDTSETYVGFYESCYMHSDGTMFEFYNWYNMFYCITIKQE